MFDIQAQVISQQLDDDKGINEADMKDFATTGFRYKEKMVIPKHINDKE